jgi:hypothetical protein
MLALGVSVLDVQVEPNIVGTEAAESDIEWVPMIDEFVDFAARQSSVYLEAGCHCCRWIDHRYSLQASRRDG